MVGAIILLIIIFIWGILLFFTSDQEDIGMKILSLIFIGLPIWCIGVEIERSNEVIHADYPEEIYQCREGDTLYINKRTKDSIYLGFKPIKKDSI